MSVRIVRAIFGVMLACGLALAVTATPAFAHAALVESTPSADETVKKPPEEAVLAFSEELDEPSTKVVVVGPSGAELVQPKAEVDGSELIQPLELGKPGKYTVSYRIVSADGHPVDGHVSFTTERDGGADPKVSKPTPDSQGEADSNSGGGVGWGTLAIIVAGVALVAVVVVVLIRAKRAKA